MLNRKENPICKKECNSRLSQSCKALIPKENFQSTLDRIHETTSSGYFPDNFIVWHLKITNLCNFRCVYCKPSSTNRWNEYSEPYFGIRQKDSGILKSFQSIEDFKSKIDVHLDNVQDIYFSGGEPVLQEHYFWIMKELIRRKKTEDVSLSMATNLQLLGRSKTDFYDLFNQFKNKKVFASLDCNGKRGEFIRQGTAWDQIERNRETLLLKFSDIKIYTSSVISKLNVLAFPDFHKDWFNKGFLNADNVRYFFLSGPKAFNIRYFDQYTKSLIKDKYSEYYKWIESNLTENTDIYPNGYESPLEKINKLYEFLDAKNNLDTEHKSQQEFKEKVKFLENISNISFKEAFPELSHLSMS
jgi:sulfatase maturation enzyme AslB (radical SAM superfamily)